MKKIIMAIICATVLAACDKVYINGDLDGMWKVCRVEYSDTIHCPTNIYYSFQRHMTQIGKYYEDEAPLRFIGHLTYSNNTITMSGFHIHLEELKQFYLHSDSSVFAIEKLNEDELIMRNDKGKYTLRKW